MAPPAGSRPLHSTRRRRCAGGTCRRPGDFAKLGQPLPEPDLRFRPVATPADWLNSPARPDRSRRTTSEDYDQPGLAEDDVLFPADLLQAIDAIAGR